MKKKAAVFLSKGDYYKLSLEGNVYQVIDVVAVSRSIMGKVVCDRHDGNMRSIVDFAANVYCMWPAEVNTHLIRTCTPQRSRFR